MIVITVITWYKADLFFTKMHYSKVSIAINRTITSIINIKSYLEITKFINYLVMNFDIKLFCSALVLGYTFLFNISVWIILGCKYLKVYKLNTNFLKYFFF